MAAGVNNVCRQLGVAFGTAFFGAILANRYTHSIVNKINTMDTALSEEANGKMIDGISQADPIAGSKGFEDADQYTNYFQDSTMFESIGEAARGSFIEGTSDIIQIAAIILGLGAVFSLFLIRNKDLKE